MSFIEWFYCKQKRAVYYLSIKLTTIPPQIWLSFLPVYSHILHSNGVFMHIWWRCSLIHQHKHFLHKYKMSCCIKLYFHISAFSQVTPQLSLLSFIPLNSHATSDTASALIFLQKKRVLHNLSASSTCQWLSVSLAYGRNLPLHSSV